MHAPRFRIHQLTSADVQLLRALNALFGEAFADTATYGAEPPSNAYLEALLAKAHVIALVAPASTRRSTKRSSVAGRWST